MADYTMQELADCDERELKMRRRVYPQRVMNGQMSKPFADENQKKGILK